ncbi:MAG: class I SAM-dependent methyltransferase [Solirubrobacterales bacterium]
MSRDQSTPDRRTVLVGRAISGVIAHAPRLWPLVHGPVMNFFDRAARDWDTRTGAGSVEHLAPLAAAVLTIEKEPERVLDVGCGTGAATLFLAREFPHARIRGVDISAAMVSRATSKIGLDPEARVAFRQGDSSKLPWSDRSFNLVTLVNMPLFFGEINRVLRPGGTVIVVATLGDQTPFSTPQKTIERKFSRLGIAPAHVGTAGRGTWFAGKKGEGQ